MDGRLIVPLVLVVDDDRLTVPLPLLMDGLPTRVPFADLEVIPLRTDVPDLEREPTILRPTLVDVLFPFLILRPELNAFLVFDKFLLLIWAKDLLPIAPLLLLLNAN